MSDLILKTYSYSVAECEVGNLDDLNRKCTNKTVVCASTKRRLIDLEANSDGVLSFESNKPTSKRIFYFL